MHLDTITHHCLVVYGVYQLLLSSQIRKPQQLFCLSFTTLEFLFPHFLCPSPGFLFIYVQTQLLAQIITQKKHFISHSGSINGNRVCMLILSVSQEHETPPTRQVFFLNKAASHLSYSSLTERFIFPSLCALHPLEGICSQEKMPTAGPAA